MNQSYISSHNMQNHSCQEYGATIQDRGQTLVAYMLWLENQTRMLYFNKVLANAYQEIFQ